MWLIDCDNQILLDLAYSLSGAAINDATVVGQLTDSNDTNVGDPITFVFQANSNGKYVGVLLAEVVLTAAATYTLTINITTPQGSEHEVTITRTANYDAR